MSDVPAWIIFGGILGFIIMFNQQLKSIKIERLFGAIAQVIKTIIYLILWAIGAILAIYVIGGTLGLLSFGWKQF